MTHIPTDAMIEAGKSAYHLTRRDEPMDVHLTGKLVKAIYTAMHSASQPADDVVELVGHAIETAWNHNDSTLPLIVLSPAERKNLARAAIAALTPKEPGHAAR